MMLQHSFGCENLTHIVGMGSAQQVHEACEVALRSYVVCLERSVEIVKVSPHAVHFLSSYFRTLPLQNPLLL